MSSGFLRGAWLALLWSLSSFAVAFIDINNPTITTSVTWTGGDVVVTQDYCVISVSGNNIAGTPAIPYGMTLTTTSGALNLTGPGAAIPITSTWTDLYPGGGTQTFIYGVATSQTNQGALDTCPLGNNGRATITVLASDLVNRPPGTYTNTLTYQVKNSTTGKKRDRSTITLNITVPTALQLSGLNTLALGTWDGINPMTGLDWFCVYINSGALYTATVTGSGSAPYAAGAYTVSNGSVQIPFTVTLFDGSATYTLSPGVAQSNLANAYTANNLCTGAPNGGNARIDVTVPVAGLQTVLGTGNFVGTLTITVRTP